MGREVRRVPADWQHPKDDDGDFIPLLVGDVEQLRREWDEGERKWAEGLVSKYDGGWEPRPADCRCYSDWAGRRPDPASYMPVFPDGTATHLMMYETTTEGTPISPALATPEELARWLVDNKASAFGGQTASYEGWLRVCNGGYAPSAVMDARGLRSGVDL